MSAVQIQDIEISASAPRRVFMIATVGGLGLVLLALAVGEAPMNMGWRLALLAMSAAVLAFVPFAWRATARSIVLRDGRIEDSSGVILCHLSQIEAVERGAFAFKPSNGFLVRLKAPAPRGWAPGLWWRFGRKLGVGGVLPASRTKYMADTISLMLADDGPIED